jgi:CRISPR/Cas system CSM-associated protein Csm3 (group 7 of RAMP superfamily)
MRFEVIFHTPFRVASGHSQDGSDTAVDPAGLLPASSIKGLMRSSARDLLKLPLPWVDQVFGTGWHPSPWSWSDATMSGGSAAVRQRARIRIDPASGTAAKGALLIADEVLAPGAEFSIERTGWLESGSAAIHEAVLLAAARAVTAVGGDRRRGLGWVTITPTEPAWSLQHLDTVISLIERRSETEKDEIHD